MIVTVYLNHLDDVLPFTIKVGDGNQSIKWLSQVIQSRIKQDNILRNEHKDDGVVVTGIRNSSRELINPVDCIYEHSDPTGMTVYVDITKELPSDQWANPITNEWQEAAFLRNDMHIKWNTEMEKWRDAYAPAKISKVDGASNGTKSLSSNFIQIGEEFTSADIKVAFDLDWSTIVWNCLNPKQLSDTSQFKLLQSTFHENYSVIYDLFNHYCGFGKVGERYGMSNIEFKHLVHLARIMNTVDNSQIIDDIFSKVTEISTKQSVSTLISSDSKALGTNSNFHPLLSRAEFVQAIVALAIYRDPESPTYGADTTELLTAKFTVYRDTLLRKYTLYNSNDPLVKQTSRDYFHQVKNTFKGWCSHHPALGLFMTLKDLIKLLLTSGIIEPEQQELLISKVLATQLNTKNSTWELEEVVFTEFLEIISQTATETIVITGIDNMSHGKKLRLAYNSLIDLEKSNLKK